MPGITIIINTVDASTDKPERVNCTEENTHIGDWIMHADDLFFSRYLPKYFVQELKYYVLPNKEELSQHLVKMQRELEVDYSTHGSMWAWEMAKNGCYVMLLQWDGDKIYGSSYYVNINNKMVMFREGVEVQSFEYLHWEALAYYRKHKWRCSYIVPKGGIDYKSLDKNTGISDK